MISSIFHGLICHLNIFLGEVSNSRSINMFVMSRVVIVQNQYVCRVHTKRFMINIMSLASQGFISLILSQTRGKEQLKHGID